KRAAVVEHAAADIALEGRFVGVNDNLVALPARAGLSRACERGICDRDERLAVRDLATRTRFRGTALLPERVAPRIQRAQEKRAVLGGKTAMHLERSVLVPEDAQVRVLVLRACLAVRDKPVGTHGSLELRACALRCELEQLLLVLGSGDPRQRPHLRVRDAATRERLVRTRQLGQRARDANMLARSARSQPAAPSDPVRG